MTCKALFWVDVPCLKELNSFMLISQAMSLQSVGRAVANRLLGGRTETPALPASGWSSPGELELLIERPRVPVDFFFPTPRFSLKTKQEVGVICVSYSMAWALVSIRSEMCTGAPGHSWPVPKLTGVTGAFCWFWGVLDQAQSCHQVHKSHYIWLSNCVKDLRRTGVLSWVPHFLQNYCAGQKNL